MAGISQPNQQQRLEQGLQFQERGAYAQAIEIYAQILADGPHPQAMHLRGLAEHLRGESAAAIPYLEQAVRLSPQSAASRNSLGAAYLACGRDAEAEAEFRRCGQLQPGFREAWHNLGMLLLKQNRPGEAALIWQQLTEQAPQDGLAWHHLGVARQRSGQRRRAEQAYHEALRWQQNPYRTHIDLGHLQLDLNQPRAAAQEFEQAVTCQPTFAQGWSNLGATLHQLQEWERAEAALQEALRLKPDFAGALFNYGNLLKDRNRIPEAIEKHRAAVALQPENRAFRLNLAVTLTMQGEKAEAIAQYRELLARHPECLPAYYSLLTFHSRQVHPEEVSQLERLIANKPLSAEERAEAAFGLGKYYDQHGDYDRAFAQYQTGNQIVAKLRPYDGPRFEQTLQQIREAFSFEALHKRRTRPTSRQPIFIFGMPRSGSTLVEQILSSHSQVKAAGEFHGMRRLISQLLPRLHEQPYPGVAAQLSEADLSLLAEDYLHQLELTAGVAPRITDKMLTNLLNLGLVQMLFPDATLIYTRRNPVDVCLSCYFQNFIVAHEYSFDLRHVAQAYRAHEQMLTHWQRVCPAPIHIVDYERLVQDQAAESRRLIETICGLPWEPECLEFHHNRRAVQTASLSQVRQPMYDSSIERWKKYAAHLGPLFEELDRQAREAA